MADAIFSACAISSPSATILHGALAMTQHLDVILGRRP
jgi:hypothetical protein